MSTPRVISPQLLGHLENFGTRTGLLRLNLRFSLHRLLWRSFVYGFDRAKRLVDIVGSLAAIMMLGPVLLGVSALVKMDGGPVVFVQTRVGRYGRQFKMFKFRSMHPDAEQRLALYLKQNQHGEGVTFKIKNDPRVTPVGRWIRRYSMDELPQLFNVLFGDMSLVGPRPPVPREVALYSLADHRRLMVKPGITCIWQVSGRAEIDFPGQVLLDVNYIDSQSLRQDLRILARTPKAVVFGTGAY
jgi:lipopolysaccharide/colanic/teichoic acid biosynthesis glycosyltransferase